MGDCWGDDAIDFTIRDVGIGRQKPAAVRAVLSGVRFPLLAAGGGAFLSRFAALQDGTKEHN